MLKLLANYIIPGAYSLLPPEMNSKLATRELLAIAIQESKAEYRYQIGGPALGFWQFEKIGVKGVLFHTATRVEAFKVVSQLNYKTVNEYQVHKLLENNDILAACFARLYLWQHKDPLPTTEAEGWNQYVETWRPGKPHLRTWPAAWAMATNILEDL
jgi:hypothetical protein